MIQQMLYFKLRQERLVPPAVPAQPDARVHEESQVYLEKQANLDRPDPRESAENQDYLDQRDQLDYEALVAN